MIDTRPDPLVPADVDLRDFPYTPFYRARLFGSAFHAKSNDAEWRAGVTLWLKSQDQVPAGSLPNDDIELCRLAELGRDLRTWRKLRANALHGWFECTDGRLYNRVTAEIALDQWQSKIDQRNRTIKARIAALEKRLSQATDETTKDEISAQLHTLRQTISRAVTGSVTELVTASKRSEVKGELRDTSSHLPSPSPDKNKNLKNGFYRENGTGNGSVGAVTIETGIAGKAVAGEGRIARSPRKSGGVTIEDPTDRLARFQQSLAQRIGPEGWDVVIAATKRSHPDHARSLAVCKRVAHDLGKGWPHRWPIE